MVSFILQKKNGAFLQRGVNTQLLQTNEAFFSTQQTQSVRLVAILLHLPPLLRYGTWEARVRGPDAVGNGLVRAQVILLPNHVADEVVTAQSEYAVRDIVEGRNVAAAFEGLALRCERAATAEVAINNACKGRLPTSAIVF